MVDWLAIWGLGQATAFVFRPILEDLAKDVAEDAAKSYVGQCFKKVYSVIQRDPLTRATGLAVKELLELIESELIRAEVEEDELEEWTEDVRRFVQQDEVKGAIAALFLEPDYQLDPKTLVVAWQELDGAHQVPDGFSWQYVAKRFASKVTAIREESAELRETFASLAQVQDSAALKEIAGLPPGFDLETYREALVERYGSLDFASLDATGAYYNDVRLWSVFVPQSVRECHEYDPQLLEVPKEHLLRLVEKGELDAEQLEESEKLHDERRRAYVSQAARPVLEVVGDAPTKTGGSLRSTPATPAPIQRLVVLGDPGSGKSSLLRFLAVRWARIEDANLRYTQPLPLLIELREYNRWECSSGKSFPKYLHEGPNWHRLNQQTLKHLLEQPDRVVLLLDGLDEVFDPAERNEVVNEIHRFSNEYKHVRIVLTSRVVGYQPHRLRSADFRHFMLQDLDEEQIGRFLDKWHDVTFEKKQEGEVKRQRLAEAIEESKSIGQLAGNPLLLTMMAILNRNQKLPDDRVDLYQQCSRLLLHQWDVEEKLLEFPGLSDEIGLREKTDILRSIAYAMQTRLSDKSRANYVDGTTLSSLIEDYLHTELNFDKARSVSRTLVEQLRVRNFILCYLGGDSYAFVHRTFLEYFCAADIVHQFNVSKTLSEDDLIALFDKHCRDDDWLEVLRLICGQIDETTVVRIVKHFAKGVIDGDLSQKSMISFALAIRLCNEARNSSRLEEITKSLLAACKRSTYDSDADSAGAIWYFYLGYSCSLEPSYIQNGLWYCDYFWPHLHHKNYRTLDSRMLKPGELTEWASRLSTDLIRILLPFFIDNATSHYHPLARIACLRALIAKWPDESRRQFITQRAVQDDDESPRSAALQALAGTWPDEETRQFLIERAVQDDDESPRSAALQALAGTWPDEETRQFLIQRAVQDGHPEPRTAALQALAGTWPDEETRQFLTQRAVQDDNFEPRRAALQALAETWPDETTRQFLTQRAVEDDHSDPRSAALQALAGTWPDEETRQFLTQRAVQDDDTRTRRVALQALAATWPEEGTRQFLTQRAVEDDHPESRRAVLQALAKTWPDEDTREFLRDRVENDGNLNVRGSTGIVLGKLHSEFGRIVFSKDLDGVGPFLDPLKPISREHIERAAEKAVIPAEKIDDKVRSLSECVGWDVTCGLEGDGNGGA